MCEQGSGQSVHGERMSYYIGFRFGWIRLGRWMVLWSDQVQYPYVRGGWNIRGWSVKFK